MYKSIISYSNAEGDALGKVSSQPMYLKMKRKKRRLIKYIFCLTTALTFFTLCCITILPAIIVFPDGSPETSQGSDAMFSSDASAGTGRPPAGATEDSPSMEQELPPAETPDLLAYIEIEAGALEITAADLFEDYRGEEVVFDTILSAKELGMAGTVHELHVKCREIPFTVTVRIIDTTPPVIEGVNALSMPVGGNISYKKSITLADNAEGDILLTVDSSSVNTNIPGTYPLYYTAVDSSGNETVAETTVTVTRDYIPTEEDTNALADAVIEEVITSDMSAYETAYTLWLWCGDNIRYAATSTARENFWEYAYDGLTRKSGDCYIYCATYALLLTRCGIDNLYVSRVGGTTDHMWNLVNTGDGWYHCDASPRQRNYPYQCFMQTDAQVQAYTKLYTGRPNYYTFDASLYPERETTVIFGPDPGQGP